MLPFTGDCGAQPGHFFTDFSHGGRMEDLILPSIKSRTVAPLKSTQNNICI
jgi:hypothetical protein